MFMLKYLRLLGLSFLHSIYAMIKKYFLCLISILARQRQKILTTNFPQITVADLGSITFLAKIIMVLLNVQI